jgi:quercetin dioxygenase-like cupin family protein
MRRITLTNRWMVSAAILALILSAASALATPSFGTTNVTLARALYTGIESHAKRLPEWNAFLKVKGVSDVFVTSHSVIPGGYSGWHSHPGLTIVSVTQGALWLYDADDPACAPTIVPAGHGFVEPGDHVHLVRNEGGVEATWTSTSIRPAGSPGRIDQPNPGNCPF